MNDALQTELASILSALRDAATTYGPDALNLALNLRRVEAAGELLSAVAGILIPLLIFIAFYRRFLRPQSRTPEQIARIAELERKGYAHRSIGEDAELALLTGARGLLSDPTSLFLFIPATPLFIWVIESLFKLLDIWNWVGLSRPELALAHDLLVKVTGQ